MNQTRHVTININADGTMQRREGSLPASIRRAPVQATIIKGTDAHLAARLLRRLADEIEEGQVTR